MNLLAWLAGLLMPACGLAGAAGVAVPAAMDFSRIERPATPNSALAAPAGFRPVPDLTTHVYALAAPALQAALSDVAAAQPRVFPLAAYPERGQMFWVARSALFNFPDVIGAEIRAMGPDGSTLVLYSRSLYGRSDFGANRKRLLAWIDALDAKTGGAGSPARQIH